jgi:hypothetical protein
MDTQKKPAFTHERAGRLLAGAAVLVSLLLAQTASPWFLLAAAGTGLNLVLSAITDRCAVKSLLIRLGLPGERDIGRAESMRATTLRAPAASASVSWRRTSRPRPLTGSSSTLRN